MRPCGIFDERYSQDMAILRIKRHWGLLIGILILLYIFPLFAPYYFISLINHLSITIIIVPHDALVAKHARQIIHLHDGLVVERAYGAAAAMSPPAQPGETR